MPRQTLKQRPDGRYACRYKGKFFYGSTQSEALAAREAYKRMEEQGLNAKGSRMSCNDYSARWVSVHKAHLTPAPYNTHVRILERFCSMYGEKSMQEITATDIQSFFNSLSGKSQSSINDARDTLKGMFRSALADRLILHNPFDSVVIPKGTSGTHRAITQQERTLMHETPHPRMRPAAMVMLYAGLRRGEVLALDIDRDIDFFAHTISVRQAVRFASNGKPVVVNPKTEAGERVIPLPSILVEELRGLHGLILTDARGEMMSESAFSRAWDSYNTALSERLNGCRKRWYGKTHEHKAMLKEDPSALPPWKDVRIRPHDLRHSYCTMLYDAGVDLKTAMKWMGHADQEMTMRVYTHLTSEREKRSMRAFSEQLDKMISSQNGSQKKQMMM